MWEFEHTLISDKKTPEQIWQIWSDVENWSQWNPQIEWSRCIGDFLTGSTIELKPVNAPQTKAKIIECEIYKTFTLVASLALGTKIAFSHNVEPHNKGIKLQHKVTISGTFAVVFQNLLGEHIESELPLAMENLLKS